MTLVLGGLGYLLKRLIWKSKETVTNKLDQARKFASNFIFWSSIVSGNFFLKNGIIEALVQMVIVVIAFGVVGFLLGLLYWSVVKEKKWSTLLWVAGAVIIFSLSDYDNFGDDMHFSIKYALLYASAGFIASLYHTREKKSGQVVALGGLALCVAYTLTTYGAAYGILTAIEFGIGYGLAQLINQKNTGAVEGKNLDNPHLSIDSKEKSNTEKITAVDTVEISNSTSLIATNRQSESKFESKSNGFWFFMAVVVMSATLLFIKLNSEKSFLSDIELPQIGTTPVPASATTESPPILSPAITETESQTKKSDSPRSENIYFELEKEFIVSLKESSKVMVIKVALMTHSDARVFDNVKKHEFIIRNEILRAMVNTTEADLNNPNFRMELAMKMRVIMNSSLTKYEDFGGVEDVFFTSFVLQ